MMRIHTVVLRQVGRAVWSMLVF